MILHLLLVAGIAYAIAFVLFAVILTGCVVRDRHDQRRTR